MFFLIVLTIWAGMHAYVFWRIASVPFISAHIHTGVLATVAVALAGVYILARVIEAFGPRSVARVLEYFGANWIGVLFLIFTCLLATDVVTGFGFFAPKLAPTLRGFALIAALAMSAIAFVQAWRAPIVSSYEVRLPNLPAAQDGTVVVVASDLHLGAMADEKWLAPRLAEIEAQRPDLLILAGDIVEGHGESAQQMIPAMRRFHAPLGVWAVYGNHETYGPDHTDTRLLEAANFNVLHDEWKEVRPGLIIAGVDDLTTRRRRNSAPLTPFVDRAFANRPANIATIYVSHSPMLAERAAERGAGLMLSGHTHNGQIWPFKYIVQIMYPWIQGRYEVNGMSLIVCRGTGTWGPRMRLWQRGEILRITLRSPETQAASVR